jgi:DNA-binding NtrC family response regulator
MARVECDYLTPALARCSKHMGNASIEPGINRKNLWENLRQQGMRREAGRDA